MCSVYTMKFPYSASANRTNKAGNFTTMFTTTNLPYNKMYNNCNNTLCFTYNKPTNYIYKPHADVGMVGTSAAGYLARRKRM